MRTMGKMGLALLGVGTSWKQVTAYRLVALASFLVIWGVCA